MPALHKPQRTIHPKEEGLYFSAFGESLIEKNTNYGQFSTPYRFNGKELDPETENYYYGARYYNPVWGIWLGGDPLAHKYPSMSSFVFTGNNPIMLVDADGREVVPNEGMGDFLQKLKNAILQRGWRTDDDLVREDLKRKNPNNYIFDDVEVLSNKPGNKQKGGKGVWGDNDEELFNWPEGENQEDPIEMPGSGGEPSKVNRRNWGTALLEGFNLLYKYVSEFGGSKGREEQKVPQSSESNIPRKFEKPDTPVKIMQAVPDSWAIGTDATISKDSLRIIEELNNQGNYKVWVTKQKDK